MGIVGAGAVRFTGGLLRRGPSLPLTAGSIGTGEFTPPPTVTGAAFSTGWTEIACDSLGMAPAGATDAASTSTPTPTTPPSPCRPARCAGVTAHDPAAWADTLERVATVFVGAGWTDEAWDLMAAAGSLLARSDGEA